MIYFSRKILQDLYEASEQSLHIKSKKNIKFKDTPIPMEIKDTIEALKYKKPFPQFFTRTEKKAFHHPGLYLTDTSHDDSFRKEANSKYKGSYNLIQNSYSVVGPN